MLLEVKGRGSSKRMLLEAEGRDSGTNSTSIVCITEWELRFWRPSRSGKEFQFYTVKLVNASVLDIQLEMLNNKFPENMKHREREHVSFVYQKITWTWENGGITSEDDWESPVV